MTDTPIATLTLTFTDPTLEDDELQAAAEMLKAQMDDLEGIEAVDFVPDPNPPQSGKGAGFLLGLLKAEVSLASLKQVFTFLGDRWGNKPIKLKVKAPNGRELELEASSREEFEYAYQKAQEFLQGGITDPAILPQVQLE